MKNVDSQLKSQFKKLAHSFIFDESGQTTTEYVLLLLFVVIAVKSAGSQLKTRIQDILNAAFGKTQDAINSADSN